MGVYRSLLLIGFVTSTYGQWCSHECHTKVDIHCGFSRHSKCEYKSINYCMVKIQECARQERGYPTFDYIVRGNCFGKSPQCREFKRVYGPKRRPGGRPRTEDSQLTSSESIAGSTFVPNGTHQ